MSVDRLVKAVWNYKQSDDVTLQKLIANIKKMVSSKPSSCESWIQDTLRSSTEIIDTM